ncbi:sulfatase-like hydrolase/transferase [Algibacter miyuki]|uniref:Sulfatase-like hydrolase/transferase n=1 Tax=Algibacter miyuki TaxID=1306933 RepID=A0ABV5H4I0_9FLAO|nr:sulfatase-like hydrolase/transferase [Algibacter miyuki]MDN3664003.1 sulfatase-like hydrolase/transferase [Algibacter miyuki]
MKVKRSNIVRLTVNGIVCFFICVLSLKAQDKGPNIILIMADDLGMECIEAYGGTSYKTPHINKLAMQGIQFENCHAQPVCTPSRVQIMTGKYNVRNYTRFGELDRSQITFGNLLKNTGYKTAIAGKWQLGKEEDSPQHFGFDASCLWQQSRPRFDSLRHDTRFSNPVLQINNKVQHFTNGEFGPDIVSDFICDFIEENKNEQFFAYYPMLLAHYPFVPTPDSKDWDSKSMGSLINKGDPKYFADMVAYMDGIVGKIVAKVESLDLSENTIIIFTGDNGTEKLITSMLNGKDYPGGKTRTTDNGTHVPFVARWDGKIKPNTKSSDLIDFSDILPTICDIANADIPSEFVVDGTSFLPQLLAERGTSRKWIYSWYSPHGNLRVLKEFTRNKEYKLYSTGKFYNVKDDFYEKNPLPMAGLSEKERQVYKELKNALKIYKLARVEKK